MKRVLLGFCLIFLCVGIVNATLPAPTFLAHMNGIDGGVVFTEEKGSEIGVSGNTNTKTAIKYLGNASAYFDGTNDYLNSEANVSKFVPTQGQNFTISFWVNGSNVNGLTALLGTRTNDDTINLGWNIYTNAGKLECDIQKTDHSNWAATGTSTQTISTSTWHQIVFMVYANNSYNIYKDGVVNVSGTGVGQIDTEKNRLYIGQFPSSAGIGTLNGYIDEVAIWANTREILISELYPQSTEFSSSPPAAPVASFTGNATQGTAPFSVQFTDTSTGVPTSWNWSFKDVTGNNTEVWFSQTQSPSYIFGVGNLSIRLNATNALGTSTTAENAFFVNVSTAIAPVANFSALPTLGDDPLEVTFTDSSTNSPTNWDWYFGNGTKFSDSANPTVVISPGGTYDINLYVSNAGGGSWANKSDYITVIAAGYVPTFGAGSAFKSNFQDYGRVYVGYLLDGVYETLPLSVNDTSGYVEIAASRGSTDYLIFNKYYTAYVYAAVDATNLNGGHFRIRLMDQSFAVMAESGDLSTEGRYEVIISSSVPSIYRDGLLVETLPSLVTNPYYFGVYSDSAGVHYYDNIVVAGTNRYLSGALPLNWTIRRDVITPSNNGVYAWDDSTSAWIDKNNNYFYVDGAKEDNSSKNIIIKNSDTGSVANTSSVSGMSFRKEFSVSQFLSVATHDGLYTVYYEDSPTISSSFWVTSSGAIVSFDRDSYNGGDTANISWYVSPGYWSPSTYTYRVSIENIYGTSVYSQAISTSSGYILKILDGATYPPGVYFAVVESVEIAAPYTVYAMSYAVADVTNVVSLEGYAMDGHTGAVLPGSNVSITQGSNTETILVDENGFYSSTGWYPGMELNITLTYGVYGTGMFGDWEWNPSTIKFTPLEAKTLTNENLSIMQTHACFGTPPYCGIGGIIRQPPYYTPLDGAFVEGVSNKSRTLDGLGGWINSSAFESYSSDTTNIAGGYLLDNLVDYRCYNVHSSKAGYTNSTTDEVCIASLYIG